MTIGFNYATRLQDQNMDSLKRKIKNLNFFSPFFSFKDSIFLVFWSCKFATPKMDSLKEKIIFWTCKKWSLLLFSRSPFFGGFMVGFFRF
jgi:hypothetical protein